MSHRTSIGRSRGFTMIELLLVVAVIALLSSLLLAALRSVRETARRTKCSSNIGQLAKAAMAHAEADIRSGGAYLPTWDRKDDGMGWLYGQYFREVDVTVCPSTDNVVRADVLMTDAASIAKYGFRGVPLDLNDSAPSAQAETGGHSYEVKAWFRGPRWWPDGTVTMASPNSAPVNGNLQRGFKVGEPGYSTSSDCTSTFDVLKKNKVRIGKDSKNVLFLDADKDDDTNNRFDNWPETHNNHGDSGINLSFADGHSEWVPRGPELIRYYAESYTPPPTNAATVMPGYSETGVTIQGAAGVRIVLP